MKLRELSSLVSSSYLEKRCEGQATVLPHLVFTSESCEVLSSNSIFMAVSWPGLESKDWVQFVCLLSAQKCERNLPTASAHVSVELNLI